MNDGEWDTCSARLLTVWPKANWPETTLAVWRVECEDNRLDGEDVYAAVRELSVSSGRIPGLADLIKTAQSIRYKRRRASQKALEGAAQDEGLLPDGVLVIVHSDNYQPIAILSGNEADGFERTGPKLETGLPDDIQVQFFVGNQRAVPVALWPKGGI